MNKLDMSLDDLIGEQPRCVRHLPGRVAAPSRLVSMRDWFSRRTRPYRGQPGAAAVESVQHTSLRPTQPTRTSGRGAPKRAQGLEVGRVLVGGRLRYRRHA